MTDPQPTTNQPTVTAQDFLTHLSGVAQASGIKSARLKPLRGFNKYRTGKHSGGKTQKGIKGKNWRNQSIIAHNAEIKKVDEAAKRVIQEQESGRITQMMKDAAIAFQNLPQPTPVEPIDDDHDPKWEDSRDCAGDPISEQLNPNQENTNQ
jgi:hypothetical protein